MVNNTGIKRPIVDIGWEAGAVASFGSAIGLTFFIFGLLVEIILFATRITKVFMPSNLWNNFIFMLWGTLAFYITHDWWLSLGLSFFMPKFKQIAGQLTIKAKTLLFVLHKI